jgi:hypothetical protein
MTPREQFIDRIEGLGVPFGREDSFKLGPRSLIADRVLVGIQAASLPAEKFLEIGTSLGMPKQCLPLLEQHFADANAVFFGIEDRAGGSIYKIYLEFWEKVRSEVRRTGSRTPQLLHLGVKWDPDRPGLYARASYTCHPLLSAGEVMRRIKDIYAQVGPESACDQALGIIRRGIKNNPAAAMIYLEVGESDNPRHSFDINLYKTGIKVADAADELRRAGAHFEITSEAMELALQRLWECPLGHISGGTDRHHREFLSVYGEIQPL